MGGGEEEAPPSGALPPEQGQLEENITLAIDKDLW
jgi:hypothetical protein